jgi:hypothetical protein
MVVCAVDSENCVIGINTEVLLDLALVQVAVQV